MNPIKIYTVDDYLLTRIAQKNYFLADKKFKIIGDFSNALDCLEALRIVRPDVILMDISLPYLNGLEATKLIREKYPTVKVIIVTSSEKEEHILTALSCGACGYVLKNNPKTNLKKVIETVVSGAFFMDLEMASIAFSKIPLRVDEQVNKDLETIKNLTDRELQVLKLMVEGKTNSQIADEMVVSTNTAKAHVGRILFKLSVTDRVQAVVKALRAHLF